MTEHLIPYHWQIKCFVRFTRHQRRRILAEQNISIASSIAALFTSNTDTIRCLFLHNRTRGPGPGASFQVCFTTNTTTVLLLIDC